jgi:CHAT domain-containing protein/Tfp pilus assembly protein PilF
MGEKYEEAIACCNQALKINPNTYESWICQGEALRRLGKFEESIKSFNEALEIKPNINQINGTIWSMTVSPLMKLERWEDALFSVEKAIELGCDSIITDALLNKGAILRQLRRYEEAILILNKYIDSNPNCNGGWFEKAECLYGLERYQEALNCADKAIELNAEYDDSWVIRGNILSLFLRRYKEAIECFDKAIEIKSNCDRAWDGKGFTLMCLGHYEDAFACLNKTLEINPNYASAWVNKGALLGILGKWEESLICCEKGKKIDPKNLGGWVHGGNALLNLNRNQEAIISIDRALNIKYDCYQSWLVRASAVSNLVNCDQLVVSLSGISQKKPELNQTGYIGALANLKEGLKYCSKEDQPEGYGQLHRVIGLFHYKKAAEGSKSDKYYQLSRDEYHQALETLTAKDFPEIHLEVLQELIRVHSALGETEQAKELQRRGTDIYKFLLDGCLSPEKQQHLAFKFAGFQQLTVDLAIQSGESIQALELAEQGKNACLSWLLYGLGEELSFCQWREIQNLLLNPTKAIVYWHISPVSLHTFILKHDAELPIVIATSTAKTEHPEYSTSLYHLKLFEDWLNDWNQQYEEYRSKGKENTDKKEHSWQSELPQQLETLKKILHIQSVERHLEDATQLILVPHRDLHRLPLHTLFSSQFEITYLPSLQIGLSFNHGKRTDNSLLSVEAPTSEGLSSLNFAVLESEAISQRFDRSKRIQGEAATKEEVETELTKPYTVFHFAGHGLYNFHDPKSSELALAMTDRLTLAEIRQHALSHYQLVTLSACETAITGNQTITTEYVGLVSGFLSVGVSHVVSTLWTVESAASALVMIEFYRRWQAGTSKAKALAAATDWLRTLTAGELQKWYERLLRKLSPDQEELIEFIETELYRIKKRNASEKLYEHPYYWAAFIITGNIESQ